MLLWVFEHSLYSFFVIEYISLPIFTLVILTTPQKSHTNQWKVSNWCTNAPALWAINTWFLAIQADIGSIMAADGGSFSLGLPCVFSPKSRQYLALCAQDGRLRIWNTDIKTLNQEYVPSAHLSATCTCISWGPCRKAKVCVGGGVGPGVPASKTTFW